MNNRYLSFLIILVFRVIISCDCASSSPITRPGVIINQYFNSIIFHTQDTLPKAKEAKVLKPSESFTRDMVIQVGAFLRESNAQSLRERLSDLLNKTVIIEQGDGYFKVRITGFTSYEDMEKLLPTLGLLGIKNIWIFRPDKMENVNPQNVVQKDTSVKAAGDKINLHLTEEAKPVLAEPTINLQVGIFHSKAEALRAQRKINSKLNLPVEIVREWEYYIVFITGFKTREEIFKYYPKLAALGYPDSFMIDNNKSKGQNK
jgi:cell division protein FtsN